ELDSIWGAERTPQLRDAVLGSAVPFAETSWKQLERVIDPYVARWAELRTQTCVATLSRVASPTTAATLGCLAQRRRALTAFLDVVAEGTPAAISTAALNAEELPDVALCGEADFVLAGFVTPHGESAAEVEVLQEAIARSAALRRAGEFERAKEAISGHQTRVDALAFPPLAQDYTFERAQLAGALDELSLEESLLLKAYAGAARWGRTSLAAEAAGQLATALAGRGETEAGRRWLAVAETGQSDNGDAALHATLLDRRGAVLLAEGDGSAAAAVYAESLAARESLAGSNSIELVESILNLGAALEEGGRFEEAQVALDRALLLARQVGNQHPVVASVLHAQAFLASKLSESAQAHALAEEELAIYRATFGNDHPRTAEGMVSLATTTVALGRPEEALALLMQADAIYAKAGPEHQLDRVAGFSQLASVLAELARPDEAAMYAEKSLRIRREILPPSHPDIAIGLHNLAYARIRQGRYEEALSLDREAGDLIVRALGREHPNLAYVHSGLGGALMCLERYAEAKVEFTRELEVLRATVGDQHPTSSQPLYNLGICADSLGDLDQANAYLTQSLAVLEATSTPDDPELSYPLMGLARNLVASDRPTEAIPFAERALRLVANGDMLIRADSRGALARALWLSRKDRTRARELADEAMREYNTVGPEADPNREGLQRWRRKHGL
ncbi:MAG: tetratricopeptide repeat protein, partial [Nannocystaceae bacterium]|nr:tetratricopeptide repeat protein [Nannocystaceae bacterium]